MNKTQRIAMLSFFACVIFLMNIFVVSAFDCGEGVLYGGQSYSTVQIGGQCWFAENLNVGTMLASASTMPNASDTNIEKWCYDDDTGICDSDGGLYSWDEAMSVGNESQGICPSDWHIPSDDEYKTLEVFLGMCEGTATESPWCVDNLAEYRGTTEGDELKKSGLIPNICTGTPCGTSYFDALLVGYRHTVALFAGRGTSAYFWLSLESDGNAWSRFLGDGHATVYRSINNKAYGYSVRCLYDGAEPSTPTYTNFTSTETTNFSDVTLSSVPNLTLAIDNKGKIAFPSDHNVNAENEDYDTHIKIEDAMIYVNSSALHSSFNDSATLTFYNIDCNKPYVFYSETASTFAAILSENQRCLESLCSNIQCAGSTLTVDVAHFTGFAAGSNANLTTEAEAGVFYPLDPIEFTAEYINSTDGTPISGECNITFDDEGTWHTMDFNSPDYNYTRSFAAAGTHEYNVTCSSADFVTLEANDTKLVSSVEIPEFSIITLGFGLIAVLIGLVVMRKKR